MHGPLIAAFSARLPTVPAGATQACPVPVEALVQPVGASAAHTARQRHPFDTNGEQFRDEPVDDRRRDRRRVQDRHVSGDDGVVQPFGLSRIRGRSGDSGEQLIRGDDREPCCELLDRDRT